MYHAFYPGQPWLDTSGERIQAHGGSIFYENGLYYWYGENKEKTDGQNGIWQWGVRCYRSADLYNWEDCGLIIPPEPEDETSPLHPSACMDRPHIIYNRVTGKYVCWLKIMERDGRQSETVLTADRLLGPYTKVRQGLRPLGMDAGDFDLAVDEDGKGYYFFERVHSELVCAELTEDYTDVTGRYSTHFPRKNPPFVREGIAHFKRNGKHYLITSGTTGYFPNPSEVAVAEDWHGPYRVLGNPHPDDPSHTSYHSQVSSVFKVPGKRDLYIALADRWLPRQMLLNYEDYADSFEAMFDPASGKKADWEPALSKVREYETRTGERVGFSPDCKDNTSISDYVWLPIRFDGEMAYLDWRDQWSLDEYE